MARTCRIYVHVRYSPVNRITGGVVRRNGRKPKVVKPDCPATQDDVIDRHGRRRFRNDANETTDDICRTIFAGRYLSRRYLPDDFSPSSPLGRRHGSGQRPSPLSGTVVSVLRTCLKISNNSAEPLNSSTVPADVNSEFRIEQFSLHNDGDMIGGGSISRIGELTRNGLFFRAKQGLLQHNAGSLTAAYCDFTVKTKANNQSYARVIYSFKNN